MVEGVRKHAYVADNQGVCHVCGFDHADAIHQKRARIVRGARKATTPTEHQEQAAVIQWWHSYAASKGIDKRLLFAIPNAQKFMSKARNVHAAYAHAKAEGLVDGVPDLMLAWPKASEMPPPFIQGDAVRFCGLFIEMKRKGEKARPDQIDMATLLREAGYNVVIAQGFDEVRRAIEGYLA